MSIKLEKLLKQKLEIEKKILKERATIASKEKKQKIENVIEVKDLDVSFGNVDVLKKVNLSVRKGETLAIIGHNGAGKTVLTETIAKLNNYQNGEIVIADNIEVGFQFQKAEFSAKYSIMDIINFFNNLKGKTTQKEIEKMIKIFGLSDIVNRKRTLTKRGARKAGKMSGGQKQRLNLLLALLQKPDVVVLDEFITGLDVTSAQSILEYLLKYKEKNKTTFIVISHQPKEIEMLADRVISMKDGKVTGE